MCISTPEYSKHHFEILLRIWYFHSSLWSEIIFKWYFLFLNDNELLIVRYHQLTIEKTPTHPPTFVNVVYEWPLYNCVCSSLYVALPTNLDTLLRRDKFSSNGTSNRPLLKLKNLLLFKKRNVLRQMLFITFEKSFCCVVEFKRSNSFGNNCRC